MKSEKITPPLAELIAGLDPEQRVDVIIELASGLPVPEPPNLLSRTEKIAFGEAAFRSVISPIEEAIASHGGEVAGRVWLNHTIRAHVPVKGIAPLSDLDPIASIDIPHRLTLDGH